jgi:hypothetical protein
MISRGCIQCSQLIELGPEWVAHQRKHKAEWDRCIAGHDPAETIDGGASSAESSSPGTQPASAAGAGRAPTPNT